MGKIVSSIRTCLIIIIRAYQYLISPLFGQCCRFNPSCSSYAIQAIQSLNLINSCYLILHRLLRCHPWCQGGYDPVPERKTKC